MDGCDGNDRDLRFLLQDADDLAETLPEWAEVSENERGIWQFEWPNDLAILRRFERSREAMSDGQRARYGELLDKLRALAPAALEETGLGRPAEVDRWRGR